MKPTWGISSAPAAITVVGSRENIIANSIKPANTRFFKIKILAIHKNFGLPPALAELYQPFFLR